MGYIQELIFFCLEKIFLKISRQYSRIFSSQINLVFSETLPTSGIGTIEIGERLLEKKKVFANVLLDVKTDNPWRILPFSDEVRVGIDGLSWLNDLAIINNKVSRELAEDWVEAFPLERLNRNIHSSSARLAAIARNFQYLEIEFKKRTLKKVNKIFKNDFFFVNFYMRFSLNILDRLTMCHSLILASYICKFTQRKQRKTINKMLSLLRLYQDHMKRGLVRSPEEISKVFFFLLETIEIATNLSNNKHFAELNILNEMSSDLGSSLRYLQFGNGNLISAHGGCLGDYNKYVKLLASMKPTKDIYRVNKLGFRRFDGVRLSMIVDASPPLYGKKHEISHAGFSSFELYHGKEAIFINCGGGSRFGLEYRKYCQSSKAHNILLLNEKSQCSFGKRHALRGIPQYYIKDGPRKTSINYEKTITQKIIELSHDAYKKDYGVSVYRKLSMDLLKNRLTGQETVIVEEELKKNMTDRIISVYFHLHPSIVFKKRGKEVVLETPGKRKMLFTYNGGTLSFEKSTYIGNFFEPQDTAKIIIESNIDKNGFKINWQIEEIVG